MDSWSRTTLLASLKLFDLLILLLAFLAAAVVVQYANEFMSLGEFLSIRLKIHNFLLVIAIIYIWAANLAIFNLYRSRRLSECKNEILDIIKAVTSSTLVLFIVGMLFNINLFTPMFLVVFWVTSVIALTFTRMLLRKFLASIRRRGRNLRNLLIVGTNARAIGFAKRLQERTELGYRILGFVDNDWAGLGQFPLAELPLQGTLNQVPAILREHVVDEVAVFLPMKSLYDETSRIVSQCEEQGIIVRILSDIFNLKLGHLKADPLDPGEMLTICAGAIVGWRALVKRLFDITLALPLTLIFAPLFGIVALLIKLDSSGPVFFIQERLGLNKRKFRLYKFRTMVMEAEKMIHDLEHLNETKGAAFKITNDPRVTRIGKILRKLSIDELPQLINVLKGDMSLVGPRPLPMRDYNGFSQDWQRRRFSVLPGLTCLWQIGGRSFITFERWMELDMEYIDHWSLWLDLKILFKTIPAVLRREGAV
jgi:exopolysaccharide biosynthesis polyprenyl glycosylphosphotransferase